MLRACVQHMPKLRTQVRTTTILGVKKGDHVVLMGDGCASAGKVAVKHTVRKLRRIKQKDHNDVLVGFAGSTADCFSLLQRLEGKLDEYPGQALRACVELAKLWRNDKMLRQLNAAFIVAAEEGIFEIDGIGNVIAADNNLMAVGSGGHFAFAAATALIDIDGMSAEAVARKAMKIATTMDLHSNDHHEIEILDLSAPEPSEGKKE